MSARSFWWASLLVVVILAAVASARVFMANDLYVFPGGMAAGHIKFVNLPSTYPDGAIFYCTDCSKTCPATGGGSGAECMREVGIWNCCAGIAVSTTSTTSSTSTSSSPTTPPDCGLLSGCHDLQVGRGNHHRRVA